MRNQTLLKTFWLLLFCLLSFLTNAQTTKLIGASEGFILDNVEGYSTVVERGMEHEEFNVLVFEDKGRELSFYFKFYQGVKICNYIKNTAPLTALMDEIKFIKENFENIRNNIWENTAKTIQVEITSLSGQGSIVVKELRN